MHYRLVGNTGLQVSEIAFGCGGTGGVILSAPFPERARTVARALELGVNYFDTSPDYGEGASETNLGETLRELGARPIITTKVNICPPDLDDVAGAMVRSAEASLKRLGLDAVDVLQVHSGALPQRPRDQALDDHSLLSLQDFLGPRGAVEGIRRLQDAGKVRFTGFTARGDHACVRELLDTGGFHLINLEYTLINPTAGLRAPPGLTVDEEHGQVIPYAAERGVGVAVFSPLAKGMLTDTAVQGRGPHPLSASRLFTREGYGRRLTVAQTLEFLSVPGRHTLAQAAVRFNLANPGVTTLLVGFSDIPQIEELTAASGAGPLSPELMAQIEDVWRGNFGRSG